MIDSYFVAVAGQLAGKLDVILSDLGQMDHQVEGALPAKVPVMRKGRT